MQQYLTLEEAANYLQMSADELREMAKKKTIRAFQDRGSWRFRSQDVEELARTRGLNSDGELQLGEAKKPTSGEAKKPAAGTGKKAGLTKAPSDAELLPADFTLDDSEEVDLGKPAPASPGPKSSKGAPRTPKPGSDSDVRLVMDGDIDFEIDQPAGKSSSGRKAKSGGDSGVRLIPPVGDASDSDVRLEASGKDSGTKRGSKSPSDSDIRLHEPPSGKKKGDAGIITEEIDLDAEEAKLPRDKPRKKPGGGKSTQMANKAGLPTESPFELSEPDFDLDAPPKKSGKSSAGQKKDVDSSSDFELIPFDASKSPVELGSGEIPLLEGDEEVSLGSEVSGPAAGSSGINLRDPVDSGISLEDGGSDEIEFELNMESGATPKPKSATRHKSPAPQSKQPAKPEDDSSSEFELSLDEDSSPMDGSSSEFELSLDDEGEPTADDGSSEFELSLDDSADGSAVAQDDSSDSEFELTLDDEGSLDVEESAGDIFEETNFDVPALEDESGSEAVAIDEGDTDLEGSDFEISLDEDSDSSEDGDSGSQVVALEDEEEADDAAATVAKPRKSASKRKAAAVDDDAGDLDIELDDAPPTPKAKKSRAAAVSSDDDEDLDDDEDGDGTRGRAGAVAVAPEWGPLPAIMLFPTVLVLFVVGIMGFELLRGMFGYHRPSAVGKPFIEAIARSLDDSLPK